MCHHYESIDSLEEEREDLVEVLEDNESESDEPDPERELLDVSA